MEHIKTIADFKRAMQVATLWQATHQFKDGPLNDLGIRQCGLHNSVNFGFIMPEKGNRMSHCNWPLKSEFSVTSDNTVIINSGWVKLTYKQLKQSNQ